MDNIINTSEFRWTNRILQSLSKEDKTSKFLNEILINKKLSDEFIKILSIYCIFSISNSNEVITNIKMQFLNFESFLSYFTYNFYDNFYVPWILLAIEDLKSWNIPADNLVFTDKWSIDKMFWDSIESKCKKENHESLKIKFNESLSVINTYFLEKGKEEFIIKVNKILES